MVDLHPETTSTQPFMVSEDLKIKPLGQKDKLPWHRSLRPTMPGPAGTVLSRKMFIVHKAIDRALLRGPACTYLLLAKAAAQPNAGVYTMFNTIPCLFA